MKMNSVFARVVVTGAVVCFSLVGFSEDLVIYGASSAGIAAAVQAKRSGLSVVIVEPSGRIGGLTTGGLGQTDIGNKRAFHGIAREFYEAVKTWYDDPAHWDRQRREDYKVTGQARHPTPGEEKTMWVFEPKAALAILESWVARDGIRVVRGKRLDRSDGKTKVEGEGERRRIVSFVTEDGVEFAGKMFVDATYEGDLMAAAGVSYTVGREANDVYGETLNGSQPTTPTAENHQIKKGVSAYVVPGDKGSGLLPGVEAEPVEPTGTGDRRVQAYCFRSCLTDDPANRIPFKKPAGYDERDYELLFRNLEAGEDWRVLGNCPLPNRKTDTNNDHGTSLDFIGANYAYPEASYAEREKIVAAHLKYQQGLFWTLAYHPRTPQAVRDFCSRWGTCKDEFLDGFGDGWQRQLYVREARRMVGDYVMTERNCTQERTAPRPVALAAYTMDSHHVRRYVTADGCVRNEGNVEERVKRGPYPIDLGAILPKRGDCANLLVPICLSASHIAYGSIRMEPVFFSLGEVAARTAAEAIARNVPVQDVDYRKVSVVRRDVKPANLPELMPPGTTRERWESVRRPEIVRTAFEAEYGVRPVERPVDLTFAEIAPSETCFGGIALRKRVRGTFSGPHGRGQMEFSVWIPKGRAKAPVFIHSSPRPAETAADPAGPRPVYLLPAEMIMRRGYAVIAYCNQDICYDAWEGPEFHDKGVFHVFGPDHLDARKPREWGILSAWAWGVSRIADWIETEPLLDARRMAVVGLSRNGKTAIVAGASDPRFALTVSCCSGRGGANLVHIDQPKAESIRQILPHGRWFAKEYFEWTDREAEMPYDQHQILALIAPRLLYVSSAQEDAWAGPTGEFFAAHFASPAWELYGKKGLVSAGSPPETDSPLQEGSVGYHRRSGKHAILEYDWQRYLDFADRHGWGAE